MSLRVNLGPDARGVHDTVDQLLDTEDGIIILIGRKRSTVYAEGFGLSGCQLEMLSIEVERVIRSLAAVDLAPESADTRQDRRQGSPRPRAA